MSKNSEKRLRSVVLPTEESILTVINSESWLVDQSASLIETIKEKYNLSANQIHELLLNKDKYVSIPLYWFCSKLGPLEVVVKYLREIHEYSFKAISILLSRDTNTIWTTYNNALKKVHTIKKVKTKNIKEELIIPLSIFSNRKFSVLESLSIYLREEFDLGYHEIGLLLDRNERTIWTVVNRAHKKK